MTGFRNQLWQESLSVTVENVHPLALETHAKNNNSFLKRLNHDIETNIILVLTRLLDIHCGCNALVNPTKIRIAKRLDSILGSGFRFVILNQ